MSKSVIVPFAVLVLSGILAGCQGDTTVEPAAVTVQPSPVTVNQPTTFPALSSDLRATISGRVVDSSTGRPVLGSLTVSAVGVSAPVDPATGNFTLANLPRSEANSPIIVTVTGPGGGPGGYPRFTNSVVALASVGGTVVEPTVVVAGAEIELHLLAGTVTGTILDATGAPAANVEVTLDAVQIPIATPGTNQIPPVTGVLPFSLETPAGQTNPAISVRTGANGVFTFTNVPEDWVYNIIVVSPSGQNLTFTNQFVPSGSRLNFPDVVGAPFDSGVANAILSGLAGAGGVPGGGAAALFLTPNLNGVPLANGIQPAGLAAPIVAGGPLSLLPSVLPGASIDTIRPFVRADSELVDNKTFTDAENTQGRTFRVRFSEPLAQALSGRADDLLGTVRLLYRGTNPAAPVLPGDQLPITITPEDAGATLAIVATTAGRLAPGLYALALTPAPGAASRLTDRSGNVYAGITPAGACTVALAGPPPVPPVLTGCDAANQDVTGDGSPDILPGDANNGNTITFTILEPSSPVAGTVTNITCAPASGGNVGCNNGTPVVNIVFGAAANAVQYFAGFATGSVANIPTAFTFGFDADGNGVLAPGELFASAGPLADPPEFITFRISPPLVAPLTNGVGVGIPLQGFQFPIVAGTENNAQIVNNYFDDGAMYLVAVEAQSMAGLRGPQVVGTIQDNTAAMLLTTPPTAGAGAVPAGIFGVGNDISARLDATVLAGMGAVLVPPASMINLTTPFVFLENLFSTASLVPDPAPGGMATGDSIPFTEGPPTGSPNLLPGVAGVAAGATPGTVGYDFNNVTMQTADPAAFTATTGGRDIFYSAADYMTAAATITGSSATIAANEDLRRVDAAGVVVALTTPTLTPVQTATLAGLFTTGGADLPAAAIASAAVDDGVNGSITGVSIPDDTDAIRDENLIRLTFADPRNFETGDQVAFTGSGITDEASNALTSTVRIANGIPAAITSAVASAVGTNHILTLNFDRPVTFPAGSVVGGMLVVGDLGLRNANGAAIVATLVGGTVGAGPTNNERSLTISVPFDVMTGMLGLSDVTNISVVDGSGLLTDDPLAFILPAGNMTNFITNTNMAAAAIPLLAVNSFKVADGVGNGRTLLLVTDQIAPRIATAVNALAPPLISCTIPPATALNAAAGGAANGLWEVGDTGADTYTVTICFSEPIFQPDALGDFLPDARAELGNMFSITAAATVGTPPVPNPTPAMYTIDADVMIQVQAATANSATISFMLDAAGAGVVAVGDTLTVTISDLSNNAIDPAANDVLLGSLGLTTGITIQ